MIAEVITSLVESLSQPGVLGAQGLRREALFARDLRGYFRALAAAVNDSGIEAGADHHHGEAVLHGAEVRLRGILRRLRPLLLQIIATHLLLGWYDGDRLMPASESSRDTQLPDDLGLPGAQPAGKKGKGKKARPEYDAIDTLGPSGQAAADWAAAYAATLVKGIDETTLQQIQAALAQGINERLGVPGTARLIRATMEDMTTKRSQLIATTEMNSAFSESAIRKMRRLGIQYKQLVLADDPCDVCEENADDGAIPVDEEFSSGDLRPPFHPRCRCAVVPARAPGEQ